MNRWLTATVRWTARISGLALAGFTLLFCVGEGGPHNLLQQPLPVQLEFVGLLMMIAGFVAGWSRAALGGIVAVAGFVLFAATEIVVNGSLPGGVIPLYSIPGLLLLICAWFESAERKLARPVTRMTAT